MKNILLIGIGGTGSSAVDIFFQKRKELGDQAGNNVTALVFDTDAGDLKKITAAKTVVMADNASVGTICDRFGREFLKEWFPCDDKAVRAQEMVRGASQWRKKSYLAFLNLMNKPLARSTFISALESMTADPGSSCEVYIIASVAGGTGSGSFIPIALYAKRYLRKNLGKDPIINAMIALPDIYADKQTPENRIKVYANAYAILRELNAINLVARNYNAGVAEHKKAPICFKIGDEKEPSVGLLFDASDRKFWTPEAAPFSQVFLLDRIPGLNSVAAHNMVLANSLYTILCTEIGSEFDSEFSNHELLRSQNNGSNAIYAGVSTSQIRFPKMSILDYLASRKTLDSCNNEWLILHKAVENAIKEKEQQAKACKRRYTMKDEEYADIVIKEVEKLEDAQNDEFVSIMERGVYSYDDEGRKVEGGDVIKYVSKIDQHIISKIGAIGATCDDIREKVLGEIGDNGKVALDVIPSLAEDLKQLLVDYYINCVEAVKSTSTSVSDAILTLDKKKEDFVGKDYSVIEQLLIKDDKYIHPVAALVQLCQLRKLIDGKLKENKVQPWDDLRRRVVEVLPDEFMALSNEQTEVGNVLPDRTEDGERMRELVKGGKSAYIALGEDRYKVVTEEFEEGVKRSNGRADLGYLWNDTTLILNKIFRGAQSQIRLRVYTAVAQNLDLLIRKYRGFFNRFEKEKEELIEQTKTARRKDATNVDSIINVYSSEEDKEAIYRTIVEDAGPITDAEIKETDGIVGYGVFTSVYNSAASEFAQDKSWNENDSGVYRSLFGDMVKAYKKSIQKSEAFANIAAFNVIEAMIAKCGPQADDKKLAETFKASFNVAQELATPSLRLDANDSGSDLVAPSNITVFMMSYGTGRYLKMHADELGIPLPADQTNERSVIKSCAEAFIHAYSGNNSARVSIVKDMPGDVLYCTGEIMDISPLRIAKFNELGDDNLYFQNYSKAIANIKKYGSDMWNPHLGNNLHKRGNLPYMNEAKEKECDIMVVKALLYAFQKELLVYTGGSGEMRGKYNFVYNGKHGATKVKDRDGKLIDNRNVALLMSWLRNEEELVEEWSVEFDKDIQRQLLALPSLASDNINEISNLEMLITKTEFMRMLTDKLYTDSSKKGSAKRVKSVGGKLALDAGREGPTAIEFAYMIKTSEELGRDCDDAERILEVLYSVFKQICEYRTNPQNTPERFIQVYVQQLGNVYESIAGSATIISAGTECIAHFTQLTSWLNRSGVFKTISEQSPMDEKGEICINELFHYAKDKDTKAILDFVRGATASKGFGKKAADEAPVAEDAE